ncbi:MAG: hypothetical protein M1819_004852 [Sarea resinae]|nr:MAG: hypothetical protein M1819_004852 [Sarea resinae]
MLKVQLAIVLAAAVGDSGHVDAVDPAPPNYGGPINVGTSRRNLKASILGERITFHNCDAEEYLASFSGTPYNYVVFYQSLWFFDDEAQIERILHILKDGNGRFATKLLIAEWALQASSKEAWPHVLATLSIANLKMKVMEDGTNVCSPVSPEWFRRFFTREMMEVVEEKLITPPKESREGMWEVGVVLKERYAERIRAAYKDDQRARLAADTMRESAVAAYAQIGGDLENVGTMDIWTGVIRLA